MTNSFADRAAYLSTLRQQATEVDAEIRWVRTILPRSFAPMSWYWQRRLVKLTAKSDYLAREIDRTVYG